MCQVEKPESEFHRLGAGLQTRCKPCAIGTAKASYQRNKLRVLERTKGQVRTKKKLIEALKNQPCQDCGRRLPAWAMHFDHLRDKVESLSRMGANNRTERTIREEAAKCEVVCVLCHRDRTVRRGKYAVVKPEHEELVRQWRRP